MCKNRKYNNNTEEKISINMSSKSRPDVGVAFAAFLSNKIKKDDKYNDYWNNYYGGTYDDDNWDDINYATSSFWEDSYDDDYERYNVWQYHKNGFSRKKNRRGNKKRYKNKNLKPTNYGRDMALNPDTNEWEYDYDQNHNNYSYSNDSGIEDDGYKEIYFYDDVDCPPIMMSSLFELDDYCNNMGISCTESVMSYLMNNNEIHCCVDPESEKYNFEKNLLVSSTYDGLVTEVNYNKAYSTYDD